MKGLSAYSAIAEPEEIRELAYLAKQVKGQTFLHINSTSTGGGVAEILNRLITLYRDVEIDAKWEVIKGDQTFFEITKHMHNGLQGLSAEITPKMWKYYLEVNEDNLNHLSLEADMVFNHDPQPAPLIHHRKNGIWAWRCHIDVSHPYSPIWKKLEKYVSSHDMAVFSASKFAQKLKVPQFIIPPAIDPLSEKNRNMTEEEIGAILDEHQIDTKIPILLQVSRFDRFKDPVGVIKAYRMVKKYHHCQLILAGGTATDDPESETILKQVMTEASGDPDIHILLLPAFSDLTINALQRSATIILQKSLKEGFGLTVAEALWKAKPVVAGAVGGIPLQIRDGRTGYLVHSVEGAAYRIRKLLNNPALCERMGWAGREHIRRNFLITRQARDYLAVWVSWKNRGKRIIHL